jgi:hypothetical protein
VVTASPIGQGAASAETEAVALESAPPPLAAVAVEEPSAAHYVHANPSKENAYAALADPIATPAGSALVGTREQGSSGPGTASDAEAVVSDTKQEASTASPPPPAPAEETPKIPAGTRPKLVVLRGVRISVEYPLYEGENYIGRADEKAVDIDLEDQEAPDRIWSSRQHALITFEDGSLVIEDLNSTNGTFVNRNRVHPGQKRPLQVNDIVMIGTVQMKVIA